MRVLFFTHEKAFGGASRALITLIDELIKYNTDIYVVVPFKKAKIVEELKKRNVKVISSFYTWWEYPTNSSFFTKIILNILYYFNFFSVIKLTRIIKKLNIDIIHSNTSVIDIGSKIANKLDIPHIWHFREFTGKHLKFIRGEKYSYKYINNCPGNIIYISKAIATFYNHFITKKENLIVYDGIPKDYIKNKKYSEDNERDVKFLFVGTLEENKGQKLTIEAANLLKQKGINNFKISFVGNDPTKYSEFLKAKIKEYNLENNIHYLGFYENLSDIRMVNDVELMCSPLEAFGLVTVEAMFSGNPVIGSNSGATPEIIKDNENGFLYKLGDANDLANKMEKIILNKSLIKTMGEKAQAFAKSNFSSEWYGKNVLKIYYKIRK